MIAEIEITMRWGCRNGLALDIYSHIGPAWLAVFKDIHTGQEFVRATDPFIEEAIAAAKAKAVKKLNPNIP